MFSVGGDCLPINLLRQHDPALAIANHFVVRPRKWEKLAYNIDPPRGLERMALTLSERLSNLDDLHFIKLNVVWTSSESSDHVAALRARTGLDAKEILRCSVTSNGARPEDWAAVFLFALTVGWDAVVISRRKRLLLWFSHDEFLRATPPRVVRGLNKGIN